MEQLKIVAHGQTFETPIISSNAMFWEIQEPQHIRLMHGEQVVCLRFGRKEPMQVLRNPRHGVILLPLDSDLNGVGGGHDVEYDAYNNEDTIVYDRFRLNTFGVLHAKQFSQAVRIVSLSKLGIGFSIQKFFLNFDDPYRLTMMCDDEPVSLQVMVRHAHLQERGIHYSAAIRSIGERELDVLRYYTASQQLR